MDTLLKNLTRDYPSLTFKAGAEFYWSPKEQIVYHRGSRRRSDAWTLLHEASHGILQHKTFKSDYELLQLELAAWEKARELAKHYSITIDLDHIEDCLDTYRDWLHKRSLCPGCGMKSLQEDSTTYSCFNCNEKWRVSSSRLCRPYRSRIEN
jgi:Domain of unknown function (DUF955).